MLSPSLTAFPDGVMLLQDMNNMGQAVPNQSEFLLVTVMSTAATLCLTAEMTEKRCLRFMEGNKKSN